MKFSFFTNLEIWFRGTDLIRISFATELKKKKLESINPLERIYIAIRYKKKKKKRIISFDLFSLVKYLLQIYLFRPETLKIVGERFTLLSENLAIT